MNGIKKERLSWKMLEEKQLQDITNTLNHNKMQNKQKKIKM
jgi:hypothetical protein